MSRDELPGRSASGRRSGAPAAPGRRGTILSVAAALALGVCAVSHSLERGAPPDPCPPSEPDRCFVSHGAHVRLEGAVARDRAAVDRAIDQAIEYWSAPPDVLGGWLITYEDHEVECNGGRASGCCDWRRRTLRLQTLDVSCPETAQLVHELGHVVLHDPRHRSARWCRETEQEATRALVRAPGASAGCAASPYYTAPERPERGCPGTSGPPP
jgi:hypothetical protein